MRPIRFVSWLAGTVAGGFLISRYLNYHPRPIEPVEAHNTERLPCFCLANEFGSSPLMCSFWPEPVTHFFYDGGPDTLVARSDIESTAAKVGTFLANSNADLVLLAGGGLRGPQNRVTWMS